MATRYHHVKFFERQKLVRKIAQVKRQLSGENGAGEEAEGDAGASGELGKKERKKLEKRLGELRVDLNYVLHYPKTKKYISLFPPEVRKGKEAEVETVDEKGKAETDRQREEIRTWVREQMEAGTMSLEPEVEVGKSEHGKNISTATLSHPTPPSSSLKQKKTQKSDSTSRSKPSKGGVADDEFFGADDGEEEEEVDGSASEGESDEDSEMDED